MSLAIPLLVTAAVLAYAKRSQTPVPTPSKKGKAPAPIGKADHETHDVLRKKDKPGPSESEQQLAEKLARIAYEKERSREGAGKGAESAPKPDSAPSPTPEANTPAPKPGAKPMGKKPAPAPKPMGKKPAGFVKKVLPNVKPPVPVKPVAPAGKPPAGFDRALAKKTAKDVANHIKGKKGNYSRDVLKLWQTRAGIPADGIYGKGSYAALKYYAGNLAPSPLFNQGVDSYPWKE